MEIRKVVATDAKAISEIYNYYIKDTVITFEEEAITEADVLKRIEAYSDYPWLVCEHGGELLGYAYAAIFKPRASYRFTVESSIYLRNGVEGRGLGSKLYKKLIADLKKQGIHSLIGIISLPNDLSVAMHEKLGFEKAAHFREAGFKFGRWIDVGYWQLMIE